MALEVTGMGGPLSDDTARQNWARWRYAISRGHTDYTEQARKCEGMYLGGGKQWEDEDRAALKAQGRPAFEFNEIMPAVNAALGYQMSNRADISFLPRGGRADEATAGVMTKVVKQICDDQQFRWKETQVMGDGLIEQRGYWDVRMNFDRNIRGEVELGTLDPRDVAPDPDSKSYDPDDWADVCVARWLTGPEIEQLYGKKARAIAEASKEDSQDFGTQDDETERSKFGDVNGQALHDAYRTFEDGMARYRVIDRQKWVYELTNCLVMLTGEVYARDEMSEEQIAQALTAGAIEVKRMKKRVRWMVSTYFGTLFEDYSPYPFFTTVPFFALFRRGQTRGMVDNAIDPQLALNKAVSQYIHIVNSAANSGWVVEQNSLTNMDVEELEEVGATTGLVLEYAKGSTQPTKIQPNQIPTGVDRLIDRADRALKDVTVPDAARGADGQAVSGVAKQSDQFASQQQLAVAMDNLAYTRRLVAKRIMHLVQRFYDSHRVFRITEVDPRTGKEVQNEIEINKFDPTTGNYLNDMTLGEYDVVVTEQPMAVTFNNSQFSQAIELRKSGIAIPDAAVVKYSNLADKHDIIDQMDANTAQANPADVAKAELAKAQANLANVTATAKAVETQFSAVQTAQTIASVPAVSGLADALLKSAGYTDHDMPPIVPVLQQAMPGVAPPAANTNPLTPQNPANPAVGLNQGIETARND